MRDALAEALQMMIVGAAKGAVFGIVVIGGLLLWAWGAPRSFSKAMAGVGPTGFTVLMMTAVVGWIWLTR